MNQVHRDEINALQISLEDLGQEFLIKQYADDTVQAALVHRSLTYISDLVERDPGNVEAIKATLAGVEGIQFMGFFSKAGDLLKRRDGQVLLQKFLLHLDQVTEAHTNIPPELEKKISQLHKLIRERHRDNRRSG